MNAFIAKLFISTRYVFMFFILAGMVSGCSSFNCTRFENILGSETDLISFSYKIAEDLTDQAFPPLIPQHPDMPILVTTFVDNNDLEKTSRFGRILQEHINSRLVQLGYSVKEIKLTSTLLIEKQSGESILSRDLKQLKGAAKVQALMVGTVSMTNRTMYVSARFINPVDRTIISSSDYQLCMDDTILKMFGLQKASNNDTINEPAQPYLNSILY